MPVGRIPGCWMALILLDAFLVALAFAGASDVDSPAETPPTEVQSAVTELEGPAGISADSFQFEAIDVFLDSGNQPLAAWQLEVRSEPRGVEIVGIEGGQHPAFRSPPYYDPRAMNQHRVILAAFQTGDDLPLGRSRIARIHVRLQGPGNRKYLTSLIASASSDGQRVPAQLEILRSEQTKSSGSER